MNAKEETERYLAENNIDIADIVKRNTGAVDSAEILPNGMLGITISLTISQNEHYEQIAAAQGLTINEYLQQFVIARVEQSKAGKPQKIPLSPDPFTTRLPDSLRETETHKEGETALVPNNPIGKFLLSALSDGGPLARYKPGGWHENPHDLTPQYVKNNIAGVGSDWRATIDAMNRGAVDLWEVVERLSPKHAQCALFALAKMGDPRNKVRYPLMEVVTIDVDEILKAKNIRRQGHNRQLLQRDIAQCMQDLSEMKVDVRNVKINGQTRTLKNCRLFDVSEVYDEQLRLTGGDFDGGTDIYHRGWAVRAGMWAQFYLAEGGRYWVSAMARALLELDPQGNRRADVLAFKIGMLWFTVPGGTDYRNVSQTTTIAELLASIGELPDEAHRPEKWVSRTATAMETALETLLGASLLASYAFGSTYPEPGDRGKGWAARWLGAAVTMTTPDAAALQHAINTGTAKLPTRLEKKRRNRGTGKPKRAMKPGQYLDTATTAAIYAAYTGRNWTQATLAREVKCARSTLSNILNRREAPGAELAARIRAFLDSA